MVLERRQSHLIINQFNNININKQVHMDTTINYVLSTFEGNINPGDPTRLKLYLQAKNEIDKENDNLDISV